MHLVGGGGACTTDERPSPRLEKKGGGRTEGEKNGVKRSTVTDTVYTEIVGTSKSERELWSAVYGSWSTSVYMWEGQY